jgi:hypothetical protein
MRLLDATHVFNNLQTLDSGQWCCCALHMSRGLHAGSSEACVERSRCGTEACWAKLVA